MRRSVIASFLLLVIVSFDPVAAAVLSNTTEIKKEGVFRYHYDSATSSCSVITLIGVGTTMKVEDYDLLAIEIAKARPGIIAGIIDHAPGNPLKISTERYSKLVHSLAARIGDFVPICRGSHLHQPKFVLGGHSASGSSAMKSLSSLHFNPTGFIGLSPFRITDGMAHIKIPSMFWGFSTTTCGVTIGHAADQAYELSNSESGRVLYQLQNPSGRPSHCVFANDGCLPICPSSTSGGYEWIRPAVGDSVGRFLLAIETNNFTRGSLEPSLPSEVTRQHLLKMFVNEDEVANFDESLVEVLPRKKML